MEDRALVESVEEESKLFELDQLTGGVNRSEFLYGADWRKKVLNKSDVPNQDVMYVNCPRHAHFLMTPIKIFKSNYGYGITFQCHHADEHGRMCLIIAQINEVLSGSKAFLRPGDILKHEPWERALEKVQKLNMDVAIKNPEDTIEKEIVLTEAPPNPYVKPNTLSFIIWDVFWRNMVAEGFCSYKMLEDEVTRRKGDDKTMRKLRDWTLGSQPITDWMTAKTGFVFKLFGDSWKIVGRTEGVSPQMPWSDPSYRSKFGFE